ncbi:MAG: riboflavin synthase [Spirochaetia bacterium]
MFTGIIEEIGVVTAIDKSRQSWRAEVRAEHATADLALGDSISINGACHTVVELTARSFLVEISPETRRVSTLGNMVIQQKVNLEKSLTLSKPLGGHLVQGHVDAVGRIGAVNTQGNACTLEVEFPASFRKYIVTKGSVCVDGVSLTIAACSDTGFSVSVIPHTLAGTTLHLKKSGDTVNLEFDIIAKYVESLLRYGGEKEQHKGINRDFLIARGF